MAAAPAWKVYSPSGDYIASCKAPVFAAMIVASLGDGATIRWGHRQIVWTEGQEAIPAGESYDVVAQTCYDRRGGSN